MDDKKERRVGERRTVTGKGLTAEHLFRGYKQRSGSDRRGPRPGGFVQEKPCCTVCDSKKRCHVCGTPTLFACSDCAIDLGAVVYVCIPKCMNSHERKCPATLKRELEEWRTLAGELAAAAEQLDIWVNDPWIEEGAKNAGTLVFNKLIEKRLILAAVLARFTALSSKGGE